MTQEYEPHDPRDEAKLGQLLRSGISTPPPSKEFHAALLRQLHEEFTLACSNHEEISQQDKATDSALGNGNSNRTVPSRLIGLRLAVSMAVAASLMFAVAIWNSQSAYGWASMLRALEGCGWVQAISSSGSLSGWVSSQRGIVAIRGEGSATFLDQSRQTSSQYSAERNFISQQSLKDRQNVSVTEQMFQLLVGSTSHNVESELQDPSTLEVVSETWRRVEAGQAQRAGIELRVTLRESKGKLHKLLIMLDPETHLPQSCRLLVEARGASRSLQFAYPSEGPESIFSLGVPRETEVVAFLAKADVGRADAARDVVANNEANHDANNAKTDAVRTEETKVKRIAKVPLNKQDIPKEQDASEETQDENNVLAEEIVTLSPAPAAAEIVQSSDRRNATSAVPPAGEFAGPAIPDKPLTSENLIGRINAELAGHWKEQGITPAEPASDTEFLRRVYLDLTGRIPIVSEVYHFLEDGSPDRRERLVDELLASRDHATHLAAVWRTLLLPDAADTNAYGGTDKFDQWLADRFEKNLPYDQLVRELLLAEGRVSDSGPILFYAALKLNPEELAAKTARTFLGMRMECAQCHDDKFDATLSQEDFWGFAAYFAQISRPQGKMEMTSAVLRVRDNHRGEVMLPDTDEVVPPRLPYVVANTTEQLSPERSRAEKSRREQLVDWLTTKQNARFARATVNRAWQHLFGLGLVEPADDMRADNPATCPEVLDTLSIDFAASGFDLRRLLRALVLSDAYQLSSRSPTDEPSQALVFARMNIKSFTADQLYDCIDVATEPDVTRVANSAEGALARFGNSTRAAFIEQFQAPPGQRTDYHAGIPQALTLMHGRLVQGATDLASSGLLKSLGAPFFTDEQRIETLFLSTLSRPPEPAEQATMLAYVEAAEGDKARSEALGDILWALLNSAEFTFIH